MRQARWLTKVLIGLMAVIAVVALVTLVWLRHKSADKADDTQAAVLAFTAGEVARASVRELPRRIEFSGPLTAPDSAVVRAKAPGTLLEWSVAEGQRVQRGQRLGRLDLADLTNRVAERQAQVQAARAQAVQAERALAMNGQLAEQNFISGTAFDGVRAAQASAQAQLKSAQAQLQSLQLTLRDAELVAPISGIAAKRQAVAGEKLSAEQPVLTIINLERLEMTGYVSTADIAALNVGMPVRLQIEGMAEPIDGELARIAPMVEPGSRSVAVAVRLPNTGERLRAGQFAQAVVNVAGGTARLTVPLAAIVQVAGQDHVWVIEDGKLLRRAVVTGRRDAASGLIEVLEGITPGAVVLAARFDNLREGGGAKVISAPAAASSVASRPVSG